MLAYFLTPIGMAQYLCMSTHTLHLGTGACNLHSKLWREVTNLHMKNDLYTMLTIASFIIMKTVFNNTSVQSKFQHICKIVIYIFFQPFKKYLQFTCHVSGTVSCQVYNDTKEIQFLILWKSYSNWGGNTLIK